MASNEQNKIIMPIVKQALQMHLIVKVNLCFIESVKKKRLIKF